ncbi:MAG: 3-phosphoshikimate 1-carboxyvinyltransferase [Alicyclobacillus sp.]|nr:3-phosphoshikimate 1-carboxyvinyltransferase [Alicyclobacillus sp.]
MSVRRGVPRQKEETDLTVESNHGRADGGGRQPSRPGTPPAEPATGRSPWNPWAGVQRVRLTPPEGVDANIEIPGSKSLTNRALVLAALAEGRSEIRGVLQSDDSFWCVEALRGLGIELEQAGNSAVVTGCGGAWPATSGTVFTGSSGTLSRFLPPALAATTGHWTFRASEQMSRRPVGPLLAALRQWGVAITEHGQAGCYPFDLVSHGLSGGPVDIPGDVSSQYLSGLLMAAPYAERPSEIRVRRGLVQPAYIELTLRLMAEFGVEVQRLHPVDPPDVSREPLVARFAVEPQRYRGQSVQLEADASTAAYFFALAAVARGRVRVTNLDAGTLQPDIGLLDILERMGARVKRGSGWTEVVGTGPVRGGFTVSLHALSDQALTVGALAALADSPITVTDVAHIRKHESDRIAALTECLSRLGLRVEERADGFTVYPGPILPQGPLPTFQDHRVAMSLSLIGAAVPGIVLSDPGCVAKTCPDFFERFAQAGVGVDPLA